MNAGRHSVLGFLCVFVCLFVNEIVWVKEKETGYERQKKERQKMSGREIEKRGRGQKKSTYVEDRSLDEIREDHQ